MTQFNANETDFQAGVLMVDSWEGMGRFSWRVLVSGLGDRLLFMVLQFLQSGKPVQIEN